MAVNKPTARKYTTEPTDRTHKFFGAENLAISLKNSGHTEEEIKNAVIQYVNEERNKCVADVLYFSKTYGFIAGPGAMGIMPFPIEKYQEELLTSFQNDKYIITVKARQLGVSTSLVFFALWASIFSTGKRCLVVAHRRESAEEFITKLKTAYEFLPPWLKPKAVLYSKNTIEFETKSVVKAMTSNPHAARSFSATIFLVDEAAFIKDADEVIKGLLPTVSASDGKLIAISTPNGNSETNWFYRTYSLAKQGLNGWKSFEFHWNVSSIFTRNPNFRYDQIRIDNGNEDKFKQEYECFKAGTPVLTPTGITEIQNIRVGDPVISHSGRTRRVYATMNKEYTGSLYRISSYGSSEDIVCTPEHPIRIYDKISQTYLWKNAEHLTVNDWVIFPKRHFTNIKLLSDNMVKLLAWYITKGSISGNQITFSLSNKETELSLVTTLLKDLNIQYSVRQTTGYQVSINDCSLADLLLPSCGSLAEYKHIPFDLISGNEELFFNELMLGDGCYNKSGNSEKYVYSTISKSLAYQVQILANSIPNKNYAAGISVRPTHTSTINGRVINCQEAYIVNISIPNNLAKSNKLIRAKYGIAGKITKISTEPFIGQVYNFSVTSDESYVVCGRAVHNCCFDVNLNCLFTKQAMDAFKPSNQIINKVQGGLTYEDTFFVWKLADPSANYIIGVDCASNKASAKDFSCFQVLNADTCEQVAEYIGKLPTEVMCDILVKTGRHYNNAQLVIEQNSYSEMLFYLLEQKAYSNLWYADGKDSPGYNTNRSTRIMLIEKLILFFNNPFNTSKLKSIRLRMQMENFSVNSTYSDGSRKYEAVKGNDDAVMALALALIPLTPKEFIHRPMYTSAIINDAKSIDSGTYSPEYIEYHARRMGVSNATLENRLKMFHDIKNGIYEGSGLEDLNLQHPVEEFERNLAAKEFVGTETPIISDTLDKFTSMLPSARKFSLDDIFDERLQLIYSAHRNFLSGKF